MSKPPKFDKLAWQRKRRLNNNNYDTQKYEKTKSGFLMRLYRNIKSRVNGIQKQKFHLYQHIYSVPNKTEFYIWANKSSEFHKLFKIWEANNYNRQLTPSVDRINSKLGYDFSNLEWVTHSENSRRGARNRWQKS